MKTKYYFDELPEDYEEVYTIDAKNKKTIIIFNVIALLIMIAVIIPVIIYAKAFFDENENLFEMLLPIILVLPSMFIYIVLHELTHGLFYKIFTHEKLEWHSWLLTVEFQISMLKNGRCLLHKSHLL